MDEQLLDTPPGWAGLHVWSPGNGIWEVTFEGLGRKVLMHNLLSWTDDPETHFFSGVATYRKTVRVPAGFLRAFLI